MCVCFDPVAEEHNGCAGKVAVLCQCCGGMLLVLL